MDYMKAFESFISSEYMTSAEREELFSLSEQEKRDAFYTALSFGTAGLRGIAGMGLNRLNRFTLGQAVRALARSLPRGSLAIVCRDARLSSPFLAAFAARVLAQEGVRVLYFKEPRPTPQLSFAVRRFEAAAGVNITASHNPKEYNGCKFYGRGGAQLATCETDAVSALMRDIPLLSPEPPAFDEYLAEGKISYISCDEEYINEVLSCRADENVFKNSSFSAVYTPFHGVGGAIMPQVLERAGVRCFFEPSQMMQDGNFPTLNDPNPEHTEGLARATALAAEKGADIVIATDPDADRAAVSVRGADGAFTPLSGNQTGALLTYYLLSAKKRAGTLPQKPAVIKTVVTTPFVEKICQRFGAECFSTFTGFKNMAEKLKDIEHTHGCVLCFEESIGYMIGTQVRDKDGISACLLLCEAAAYFKSRGQTLQDALEALYSRFGRYGDCTLNIVRRGEEGARELAEMMRALREDAPRTLCGVKIISSGDYLTGENVHIKGSDVLQFDLENGSRVLARPSGTEPKLKIYALSRNMDAQALAQALSDYIGGIVK